MAKYRIIYLDILILSAALFAAFEAYLFHLLLIVLLILPILSFLMLLPVRKNLFCELSVDDDMVPKGETALMLQVRNNSAFPCFSGIILIRCENALGRIPDSTGEEEEAAAFFFVPAKRSLRMPASVLFRECGRIDFGIGDVKIYDLLRLFCLRIPERNRNCETDSLYVLPDTIPCSVETENNADAGLESAAYSTDHAGNDPSEIFDLRDYVPGDARHSIHWKLSGRMSRLIVKEYGLPLSPMVHFLVEIRPHAKAEEKENAMGTLVSISEGLISKGILHEISWIAEDSVLRTSRVSDAESLAAVLHELLGTPAVVPYESVGNLAMQSPFLPELHLVLVIGGTIDEKELNGTVRETFSMLLDRNMCRRITVMPFSCSADYVREVRTLGCDVQLLNGRIPEDAEEAHE